MYNLQQGTLITAVEQQPEQEPRGRTFHTIGSDPIELPRSTPVLLVPAYDPVSILYDVIHKDLMEARKMASVKKEENTKTWYCMI
jgi:hypothetical protein